MITYAFHGLEDLGYQLILAGALLHTTLVCLLRGGGR